MCFAEYLLKNDIDFCELSLPLRLATFTDRVTVNYVVENFPGPAVALELIYNAFLISHLSSTFPHASAQRMIVGTSWVHAYEPGCLDMTPCYGPRCRPSLLCLLLPNAIIFSTQYHRHHLSYPRDVLTSYGGRDWKLSSIIPAPTT